MQHHRLQLPSTPLPDTFSLLCWNVHKEMGRVAFTEKFRSLLQGKKPELILLQEAVLDRRTQEYLPSYNYSVAVNIDLRRKQYGVLTAARCSIIETVGLKTYRREMHFATKKSLLLTTHPFADGTQLTAVNLHAINFVSSAFFVEEIDRLTEALRTRTGPMIVTGDFNTWSKKRIEHLDHFARTIGLEPARFTNSHHIKQRFSKPLDHLYYRGLELTEAEVIDTGKVSDHNPIVATFRH